MQALEWILQRRDRGRGRRVLDLRRRLWRWTHLWRWRPWHLLRRPHWRWLRWPHWRPRRDPRWRRWRDLVFEVRKVVLIAQPPVLRRWLWPRPRGVFGQVKPEPGLWRCCGTPQRRAQAKKRFWQLCQRWPLALSLSLFLGDRLLKRGRARLGPGALARVSGSVEPRGRLLYLEALLVDLVDLELARVSCPLCYRRGPLLRRRRALWRQWELRLQLRSWALRRARGRVRRGAAWCLHAPLGPLPGKSPQELADSLALLVVEGRLPSQRPIEVRDGRLRVALLSYV